MVEIEMEVDIGPQYGTEARLDDDLIDYDAEVEREPNFADNLASLYDEPTQTDEDAHARQQTHEDVDYFEGVDPTENADAHTESHALERTSPGQESSHEIDYDVEDASDLQAFDDPSETRPLAAGEQNPDGGSYTEDTLERQQDEDQEINWEHEHGHEPDQKLEPIVDESDPSPAASGHDDPTLSTVSAASETMQQEHNEQKHKAHPDLAEESGFRDDSVHDERVDEGVDEYEILEADASHGEEINTNSHQFPAITVQYKGDEFPCFSATSDGFFSQLSLLDESIKSVLEGFREELSNELLPEDELVFQVDELGLEFSESCSPELLANITFRQVIELFDVLVRNQDPDNTRPLYTYLFTRPSTSKRLDFLMESAAEGKGLEEVIHLFQSPIPHTHGASTEDDSVGTQFDEIESAVDGGSTETNHVFNVLDANTQISEVDINDDDVPHQRELVSGNSPKGEEGQSEEEILVSGALAAEDDVGDGEEEVAELEEGTPVVVSRPPSPVHGASDGDIRSEEGEETAAAATTAVELEQSEADDILGIDFDEPVELTATNGVDEGQDEVEQQDTHQDKMHAGSNDASTTTTTVKDDAETLSAFAEFDTIDDGTDELMAKDKADEEVVEGDEIDWRDEPETLLNDVDEDGSCNTGKRARCDEENGAEDDQDAKRRRS
ncbi:hypothetical protein E4U41_000242 [Claviceps citrina]|nr:hypothetical protein E4U41_000242 [Claviceps citrina]